MAANCHGLTLADGRFPVNDSQLEAILQGGSCSPVSGAVTATVACWSSLLRRNAADGRATGTDEAVQESFADDLG